MSDYPIVKNLPTLPGRGRKEIYPWRKMEVGDSFPFIALQRRQNGEHVSATEIMEEYTRICYAAAQAAKRHNRKYRISKEELRVQRIA